MQNDTGWFDFNKCYMLCVCVRLRICMRNRVWVDVFMHAHVSVRANGEYVCKIYAGMYTIRLKI